MHVDTLSRNMGRKNIPCTFTHMAHPRLHNNHTRAIHTHTPVPANLQSSITTTRYIISVESLPPTGFTGTDLAASGKVHPGSSQTRAIDSMPGMPVYSCASYIQPAASDGPSSMKKCQWPALVIHCTLPCRNHAGVKLKQSGLGSSLIAISLRFASRQTPALPPKVYLSWELRFGRCPCFLLQ
jgi:hypothetical protein